MESSSSCYAINVLFEFWQINQFVKIALLLPIGAHQHCLDHGQSMDIELLGYNFCIDSVCII